MEEGKARAKRFLALIVGMSVLSKHQKRALIRNSKTSFIRGLLSVTSMLQDGIIQTKNDKVRKRLVKQRKKINKLRDGPKDKLPEDFCKNTVLLDLLADSITDMIVVDEEIKLPKYFLKKGNKKTKTVVKQQGTPQSDSIL